jgi:drug/metabolite transporter (DMT)-like permease
VADIALLGAVISAAIGYTVGAKLSKKIGSWQVICWALVLVFPFALVYTINKMPESISSIPAKGYISFLYLSLISQWLAFFVWYKGLALGGIARVSQVQLLQPFITLLASVLFLGEVIDVETIVFISLVVCTVWLSKKTPIVKKPMQSTIASIE